MSDQPGEQYALPKNGQAHLLARHMMGRWVSALRASIELHITEIHPRLPDIERAGGAFKKRMCGTGGEKWAEYTLTRLPLVRGYSREVIDAKTFVIPDENAVSDFVPPPKVIY